MLQRNRKNISQVERSVVMEHITHQPKKYQRNRLFQERVEKYEGTSKFSVIQQRSLFDTEGISFVIRFLLFVF